MKPLLTTSITNYTLYFNDKLQEFDLDATLNSISEQRRQQALRFRHEQGRRECVAAYLLLKEGLQREYGITGNPEFSYDEGGKPSLKDYPDIHFNLSHCREAAACAISNVPMGVDIETIRPFKEPLARKVLSDEEYNYVMKAERPDVEFIKFWTRKEALLKLTGEGIRSDLKTVLNNDNVEFDTSVTSRYVYSVCFKSSNSSKDIRTSVFPEMEPKTRRLHFHFTGRKALYIKRLLKAINIIK